MAGSKETGISRSRTDENLQAERDRSDEELRVRSAALAEDADAVIERARARATKVLALARDREDLQLNATGATTEQRTSVRDERSVADTTLAAERAVADATRLDERERRDAALLQLLALERSATDKTLADERTISDESIEAREDLLALVAHDLRNMLSTIAINSSIIVIAPQLHMVARPAAHIQQITGQMAQLLEDLLDFSCFEAGKLTVAQLDVDVTQVVADAVSIHQEVAASNGVTLTLHAGTSAITVRGDARRLTRMLMNLIGNALKFTPTKGRVDVSVSVDGGECEIAVTDTGIGIPTDQLQAIFERYRQITKGRTSGVGLGLYITRLIAEAHAGRVWAENVPSGGATFKVRLPLVA